MALPTYGTMAVDWDSALILSVCAANDWRGEGRLPRNPKWERFFAST